MVQPRASDGSRGKIEASIGAASEPSLVLLNTIHLWLFDCTVIVAFVR